MDKFSSQNQIDTWLRRHAVILLSTTLWYLMLSWIWPVYILLPLSFALYFFSNRNLWVKNGFLGGAANWVSLLRLGSILICLVFNLSNTVIAITAALVIAADGLDGFLARKLNLQSVFGEYLDKEIDASFIFLLCLIAVDRELMPHWILICGLLRYLYIIVLIWFKPSGQKEGRSFRGQTIAVLFMAALWSCFVFSKWFYEPLFYIASLALFYSFGKSFLDLRKTQKPTNV